jgi:hypothetical protein
MAGRRALVFLWKLLVIEGRWAHALALWKDHSQSQAGRRALASLLLLSSPWKPLGARPLFT